MAATMSPNIFSLVAQRRGSISAEHGVGLLKRDFLDYSRSDEEMLMRGLKALFDPHQILIQINCCLKGLTLSCKSVQFDNARATPGSRTICW